MSSDNDGKSDNFVPAAELLCPICGRDLKGVEPKDGGWTCKCGEFIPEGMVINPFEGCTHGLNCNCGREMKR